MIINGPNLSCTDQCDPPGSGTCQIHINHTATGMDRIFVDDPQLMPGDIITCDCEGPTIGTCPLPQEPELPICEPLQSTDCIADVPGPECRPSAVVVQDGGLVDPVNCGCFFPGECAPIKVTPGGPIPEDRLLTCEGDCATAEEICQVHVNGDPTGETSVHSVNIDGGRVVTCQCAPQTGACCVDNDLDGFFETCHELTPNQCAGVGGFFHGLGTTCQGVGACCVDADGDGVAEKCIQADKLCCEFQGGIFHGPGSPCLGDSDGDGADDACVPPQPQCPITPFCADRPYEECIFDDPNADQCLPFKVRIEMGQPIVELCDCAIPGGCGAINITPIGGDFHLQCPTADCPPPDMGFCQVFINGNPTYTDRVFASEVDEGRLVTCECAQPQQPEACCINDPGGAATCIMLLPNDCLNNGGTPQGAGTFCTQPEACCLASLNDPPTATCLMVDPLCCDDLGGTPQGAGSSCNPTPAGCCLPDNTCVMVDPICCDDIGGLTTVPMCLGDSDGDGADDACLPPQFCPIDPFCEPLQSECVVDDPGTNETCLPTGVFVSGGQIMVKTCDCVGDGCGGIHITDLGGDYHLQCNHIDCPPPDTGICQVFIDGNQTGLDRIFASDLPATGGFVTCGCAEPQEPEACCIDDPVGGATCIMLLPNDCLNSGGTPQGAGTFCTAPQACCLASLNDPPTATCLMVDPLCCDDLGGTPQGPGSTCNTFQAGCCLPDNTCVMVDPLCCDDIGGTGTVPTCLGDSDGDGADDACLPPQFCPIDPFCAGLQGECVVNDPTTNEICLPTGVFVAAGTIVVKSCECVGDGCGGIHITDLGGDYHLQCNHIDCPPPDTGICQVFIDGNQTGLDRIFASDLPATGGFVTCGCAEPQDFCPLLLPPTVDPCGPLQAVDCPSTGLPDELCLPQCVHVNQATGGITTTECGCRRPNDCHIVYQPGVFPPVDCQGGCPTNGTACVDVWTPNATGGFDVCCDCFCPWDINNDGKVDAADLAQLLGSWGPYGPCPPFKPADFDHDCDVDAGDLANLLGHWGLCPP